MSTNIDKRIVEMQFDNAQFQKGVEETEKSLKDLKKSLNFEGSTKGMQELEKASKSFSLSSIGDGVSQISSRFTALGIIGVTALSRITNAAIDCGKKMISALTIDPVKTGFSEYETQINAVQTILANTSDEMNKAGYSQQQRLDIVNEKLDQLNHYADKTIYNFTEMTRNIGTFTAAGIDLNTSVNAIQGIANLAAVSGSTSQQASTAMYQLSQALATGTVKLMDWNSVVNAGMGGEVFQKALIRTADALGVVGKDAQETFAKLKAGEVSFRDSLKDEWLTSEILTETLSEMAYDFEAIAKAQHTTIEGAKEFTKAELIAKGYTSEQADEIINLAETATEAATKVKTFSQLFDTLKEAAQSGWTQTWEYIIGDFEEAKALLTDISDYFGGIIGASADARNKVVSDWKNFGGRRQLVEGFWNIVHAIENVVNSFKGAFEKFFPPATGKQLFDITRNFNEFTKKIRSFTESAETLPKLEKIFGGIASAVDILRKGLSWVWNGFKDLIGSAEPLGSVFLDACAGIGEFITNLHDSIGTSETFQNILTGLGEAAASIRDLIVAAFNAIIRVFGKLASKVDVSAILSKIGDGIAKFVSAIPEGVKKLREWGQGFAEYVKQSEVLKTAYENVKNFLSPIIERFQGFGKGVKEGAEGVGGSVSGWFGSVADKIKQALSNVKTFLDGTGTSISGWFTSIRSKVTTAWNNARAFLAKLFGETIPNFFTETVPNFLSKVGSGSLQLVDWITKMITPFANLYLMFKGGSALGAIGKLPKAMAGLGENIKSISDGFKNIGDGFKKIGEEGLTITKIAQKKDSIGTTILKIASAITMLVGSIWVLSQMKTEEIGKGLGVIGIIAGELFAISLLFSKAETNSDAMIKMAGAVTLMLIPIKVLSAMEFGDALKGIGLVGVILGELAIFMRLAGSGFSGKTSFIGLSIAVNLLVLAIHNLGEMDVDTALQGVVALGVILTELGIFMRLAGKGFSGKTSFLSLSIAVNLLVFAIRGLAEIDTGGLVKGLVGLGAVFLELALFMKSAGSSGKVGGMITMALGINLMVLAVKQMGELKLETIAKGVAGLGAMMLAFGAMIKLAGGMNLGSALVMLVTMAGTLVLFVEAFKKVEGMNTESMLAFALSLSATLLALSVSMKLISTIPITGALTGLASFAILIVGIGAIITALGALQSKWGDLSGFLESGGDILGQIGTAIGKFVGGIVGGFVQGLDLPQIGQDLTDFMNNASGFIEGAKKVDGTAVAGVGYLVAAILAIGAGEFVNAILTLFSGENPIVKFSGDLKTLAEGLKGYAESVSGFTSTANVSDLAMANATAKALSTLNNSLPATGGKLQKWLGTQSLGAFAAQLPRLATGLGNYATSISGFSDLASDADIKKANSIATALSDLNNSLPATGGKLQKWLGTQSLGAFAAQLPRLATGLKKYATSISGFSGLASDGDIKKANSIATALSDLNNSLPATGGKLQKWLGTQSLGAFAAQLPRLATGLGNYATSISGFSGLASDADFTTANSIATALSDLNNSLPATDGVLQKWIGGVDLGAFATNIGLLGEGLSSFAENISGVSTSKSGEALDVLDMVKDFIDKLDPQGGVWQALDSFVNGDQFTALTNYTGAMRTIGLDLSTFATKIADVDTEDVEHASTVFESVSEFISGLSESGGVLDAIGGFFTGGKSKTLTEASGTMATFGNDFKAFADGISNIATTQANFEGAKQVLESFKTFNEAVAGYGEIEYSDQMSDLLWILDDFGISLANFGVSLSGVDVTTLSSAATIIDTLVRLAGEAGNINPDNVAAISSVLEEYGNLSVGGFVSGMEEQSEAITTAVSGIITALSGRSAEFETAGTTLANSFTGAITSGLESNTGSVEAQAKNLASSGATAANGTYAWWYMAGRNLAVGLANGITSKTAFVRSVAINVAKSAISGAQRTFDEHSPSKVGYDLGMNFDLGIAGGIDGYRKTVSVSSANMAEGTISSAKIMLADLSNVLANGVDTTPTIRPVLDLSNIQNGVGAIDGMFESRRALGMSMFGGSSFLRGANTLNFDGAKIVGGTSNKDVVSEIQTLNNRMTDLTDAVANMKLVLDTGTLVGATSVKMDRQLGTIAARKGRGN